ncbi:hypothetical protein E7811_12395 [Aliigemmobacter aestuarii]|uniref:Uncharacterized protein n=1 Tax=Aliigemmobacter aestuarii TaxID=1445661 RepID=A0A4S3MMA9_9RHOB|nr:hypothetical protein [Gemmobacter aestuarii]THD82942.1 hypothetical protein E7811_12395 [Gemmobacter aestuarii]
MNIALKDQYALGVADLEGPQGGFVLRRIVRQSRLPGKTGAAPWGILPDTVLRFRQRATGRVHSRPPSRWWVFIASLAVRSFR